MRTRTERWSSCVLALLVCACAPRGSTGDRPRSDAAASPPPARDEYDPISLARASAGRTVNREASVPSQCYTKTEGRFNPCWTCHTGGRGSNAAADWRLQEEYSFSELALENRWTNLFVDRRQAVAQISDDAILAWIDEDNYGPLRLALRKRTDYAGYVPDLDLNLGFDDLGFALDGSGWRAVRYQPFPGTFWPANGSTDDVFVRLAPTFRRTADGRASVEIHRANLSILEAALTADLDGEELEPRDVEPLDERLVGVDLDGNGRVEIAKRIAVLPPHYAGGARGIEVVPGQYPAGTELLHTVRYVDPRAKSGHSRRLKELRYMKKTHALDAWAIARAWERERSEKDEGVLPQYRGSPELGYRNDFGWQLQGFIEDARGRLRLQTEEEHRFCMGCHSAIGVTIDSTFALPRKLPGSAGWAHQTLRGLADVPQRGHTDPEVLVYFRRGGGGDELRSNTEILSRFFPGGRLDERAVRVRGRNLSDLLMPSTERALLLDKAYRVIVSEQSFVKGRDATVQPAAHVHRKVTHASTGLAERARVHTDGQLLLDWTRER